MAKAVPNCPTFYLFAKAMRMPNLSVSKQVRFQHWMEKQQCCALRVSRRFRQFEQGMKGLFVTRTGNVANVETVEPTPAIDSPEDPSNGRRALRFKRSIALSGAIPRRRRVWQCEC